MRNILIAILILMALGAIILMGGCGQKDNELTKGQHPLRKMVSQNNIKQSFGGFFLFGLGSIGGQSENNIRVHFSWLTNDGTYAITSAPIEKFRIKIDNNVQNPFIEFIDTSRGQMVYRTIEKFLDYCPPNYILVTCRDEDWPKDIQLPLNR